MIDSVSDLSNALAAVVERSGPGVVRIEGRRRGPSSGAVWSADGLVVTTSHVLEWDENIKVGLPDGTAATAALVGRDPTTDLALLRVPASGLGVPDWADVDRVKVGHLTLAVSRPGRSVRASLGVVSAVGDPWRTRSGGRIDRYIETDLGIYPGFSGSLLADSGGRALGLNTSGLIRGLSLAVPGKTVRRVAETLIAHGHVRRGYLGVGTYPVPLSPALEQQLGQSSALLVVSVEPESPAARAGLLLGDALVSFGGQPVRHPADLLSLLDEESVGTEVKARIIRAGEMRELTISVGTRPAR